MDGAGFVAEERAIAGAAVLDGNGGELIFGGRAGIVSADDDITENVAILAARGETCVDESRLVSFGNAFGGRTEFGKILRQVSISEAILLDRGD